MPGQPVALADAKAPSEAAVAQMDVYEEQPMDVVKLTGKASYGLAWVAVSRIDAEAAEEASGGVPQTEDGRNVEMDRDGEDAVRCSGSHWDCTSDWACKENRFAPAGAGEVVWHAGEARDWN